MASGNVGTAVNPAFSSAAFTAEREYQKNLGTPTNYEITIVVTNDPIVGDFAISSALPERISLTMSSTWATPFAKFGDALPGNNGGLLGTGLQMFGLSSKSQFFSAKVWESSSGLGLSVPLQLRAFNDSDVEVRQKLLKLMSLQAPTKNGALLEAPGPRPIDAAMGGTTGRQISVLLGSFLTFDSVVIKSVTGDVDMFLGANGTPISSVVNLDFETYFECVTVQDLEKIFNLQNFLTRGKGQNALIPNINPLK